MKENKAEEEIAEILRDNLHFSGQINGYLITGAIQKIIEWSDKRNASQFKKGDQTEQKYTKEQMNRCWDAAKDEERSRYLDFETWLKCQIFFPKNEQRFTIEDMREAFRAGQDHEWVKNFGSIDRLKHTKFDEWIKTKNPG